MLVGQVGIGLSEMFSESGYEVEGVREQSQLANSMGLFLQKTNIIRDYLEDYVDGRAWWPMEIWKQYGAVAVATPGRCRGSRRGHAGGEMGSFADRPRDERSVACLNHMVTDALAHVEHCLNYLDQLRCPEVFR